MPAFDHVLVIVFENKAQDDVLGSSDAPGFNSLASRYAVLSRYHGITHPSLPNYLALISGSTQGIHSDCSFCLVSARNLADTLPRAHRTWKAYAEGLPEPGYTGASFGRYAKKHMPFLYFQDVTTSPSRRRRVVPLRQFPRDLAANRLPSFSLVVPNLCHDMHDCSVATGDAWLNGFLKPLLRSRKLANSVVFVVFDETEGSLGANGLIPALALGPAVVPGSRYRGATSHYGLLRTIEDAWGLPRLGRSRGAAPITGIWR
ncbi:MAG TPA: alkaline phosphatase family protein [Gaiellaceae bacterium]|nr:alkaline phosphatase family protein [Gaiellaceae bacterium]